METRLDKEKKTALKELNRVQNLLLREKRQPSRPVTRASTLWSAVEHNSRESSLGQSRQGKLAEVTLRSASAQVGFWIRYLELSNCLLVVLSR